MVMDRLLLTNSNIQKFNNELNDFVDNLNIKKYNKTWLRLFFEEILLKYHDTFGDKTNFYYSIRKRFSILLVDVYVQGEALNVLRPEGLKNTDSSILDNILANKGDGEILYKYRDDENVISVSLPIESRKIKIPGSKNLHAIVLGILVGLLLKYLLSPANVTMLIDGYISPIYSSLMATLKGLMEPVIFVSLVVGICAIGDLRSLSTIGKEILLSFIKTTTFIFTITVLTCVFAFPTNGSETQTFDLANIVSLLLTSIPENIIKPFYEGNMIQIVIIGFISGIAILVLGEKASGIKKLLLEFKFFFFTILDMFAKFLPFVVFLSTLKAILSTSISDSAVVWKIIVIDQLLVILIAFINLLYTSANTKVSMGTLFKKMKSIFSISFYTGSSTAAIPEFYNKLPNAFGIDEKYSNYWIPLSNSFFSPSTIVALIVYSFFSAQSQNVGISFKWLIIMYIMTIQIGMATPRIPGGIIASCTIMFSQLGLTTDQLGIIMVANVLVLYLDTAIATITRCCCAINSAKKQGYIDLNILKDPTIN